MLADELFGYNRQVKELLHNDILEGEEALPQGHFFLPDGAVVCLPRKKGVSRYPYGHGGFNFWVYSSGMMHANEGLFSWFLKPSDGQEPPVAFYLGLPGSGAAWQPVPFFQSLDPLSLFCEQGVRYTIFTPLAAYFILEYRDILAGLRVFVTPENQVCFSVMIFNEGTATRRLQLSSCFHPYMRHQIYESDEDRWFKKIERLSFLKKIAEESGFLISVNEDRSRFLSVTNRALLLRRIQPSEGAECVETQYTTSRLLFNGSSAGNFFTPYSLYEGGFEKEQPVCTFTQNALAAEILPCSLPPGESFRTDLVLKVLSEEENVQEASAIPPSPVIDAALEKMRQKEQSVQESLTLSFEGEDSSCIPGNTMTYFMTHLKKQIEFCSLLKGYIQLKESSLIGIRDVFQALEGLMFWQPDQAVWKMLEALPYMTPDGRCFRQYSLPSQDGTPGRMDLRLFIDQGVWVISTVYTYLCLTGDWNFLEKQCAYHEIVSENSGKVRKTDYQESVLDHLLRIMDYLLDQQDPLTHCIRALYGDWNDALDGLGISRDPDREYGDGVSVMATLQVYRNLEEMSHILEKISHPRAPELIALYSEKRNHLETGLKEYAIVEGENGQKKILHGWGDKYSYQVGGYSDPDGKSRDGLTSPAFWVLSGLHEKDPGLEKDIKEMFTRLDSKYGMKTFEPYFEPDAPGVGRIGKLPPGTAENAASYIHATTFAIQALFHMGNPQWAWEQIEKILPFTSRHKNYSVSPFVMPNSYGFNEELFIDGESMNDWQTGSSNVLLKIFIRNVMGFCPAIGGVWIQPAGWAPFHTMTMKCRFRERPVRITLWYSKGLSQRIFTVNGQEVKGTWDKTMKIDKLFLPADNSLSLLDIQVSSGLA